MTYRKLCVDGMFIRNTTVACLVDSFSTLARAFQASRSWMKKLNEERRMLALAKAAVKHHKERVKKRQQRLVLYQARWRDQRQVSE